MNNIRFAQEPGLSSQEFCDVLRSSGLAERRPIDQIEIIETMLRQADLILTARDQERLVGVSRCLTDFAYCTYLSDLAVDQLYQNRGIGRRLIQLSHEAAGLNTTLILLAAPKAVDYYPKIGMEAHPSCWITRPRSTQIK